MVHQGPIRRKDWTPMTSTTINQLLTTREVCDMLRIGKTTLWRWSRRGDFPQPVKLGHSTRWRQADIQAMLNQSGEVAQ